MGFHWKDGKDQTRADVSQVVHSPWQTPQPHQRPMDCDGPTRTCPDSHFVRFPPISDILDHFHSAPARSQRVLLRQAIGSLDQRRWDCWAVHCTPGFNTYTLRRLSSTLWNPRKGQIAYFGFPVGAGQPRRNSIGLLLLGYSMSSPVTRRLRG